MGGNSTGQRLGREELALFAEEKLRRIFVGALGLCALVLLEMLWTCRAHVGASPLLIVGLLPILFWALIVTGYAFRALWIIAGQRRAELEKRRQKDPVTGVFTDSYLDKQLPEERRRALETGKSAAFAYIRVSGLEEVNENYGFAVGDIVLRALVEFIVDAVLPGGIVARLAGQQFAVLLRETPPSKAQAVVDLILERIRSYRLDLGKRGTICGMDAVVGIAAFPVDGDGLGDITQAAVKRARARGPAYVSPHT